MLNRSLWFNKITPLVRGRGTGRLVLARNPISCISAVEFPQSDALVTGKPIWPCAACKKCLALRDSSSDYNNIILAVLEIITWSITSATMGKIILLHCTEGFLDGGCELHRFSSKD